jgi:hypothetical protein
MAFPRIGGAGIPLNLVNALGAPLPIGISFSPTRGTNAVTLAASEVFVLPAGTYLIAPGQYSSIQFLDPVVGVWRTIDASVSGFPSLVDSDGGNIRIANLTGTAVGALITNSGSSYTNGIGSTATGLTVTISAGASTWVPVVGGAINSTVTVTAGGSGYLYPPVLVIDAPPTGGVQATATCTISAGAVNAVTVINQGAGYVTAPNVAVINDSRDTAGSGAILTVNATLANSGGLTALYPSNNGTAVTNTTTVPTFTFSPASSTAATCLMNWTLYAGSNQATFGSGTSTFTVGTAGVAYAANSKFLATTIGGIVTSSPASNTAGPIISTGLVQPRPAQLLGTATAGGAIGSTEMNGALVLDYGFGWQSAPVTVVSGAGSITTVPVITTASTLMGGVYDTSFIQPI